jgi:hypothetical protein
LIAKPRERQKENDGGYSPTVTAVEIGEIPFSLPLRF